MGSRRASKIRKAFSETVAFRPGRDRGVPRAGLEPAASRSSVLHSPKLSYRGVVGPTALGYKESRAQPRFRPPKSGLGSQTGRRKFYLTVRRVNPGMAAATANRLPAPGRPFGVSLLAVLVGLYGFFLLVVGVALLVILGFLNENPQYVPTVLPVSLGSALILSAIVFLLGLIVLGVAFGLWHQRVWALVIAIIVLVIVILGDLATFSGAGFAQIITLGIPVLLLIYLLAVRSHFN